MVPFDEDDDESEVVFDRLGWCFDEVVDEGEAEKEGELLGAIRA